jgi:DNA-binding response OmpR family regulator
LYRRGKGQAGTRRVFHTSDISSVVETAIAHPPPGRENADPAIVYLMAFSDEETIGRTTARQLMGYLLKPFNDGELRATIQVAAYKRSVTATLAQRQQQLAGGVHELTTVNGLFQQQLSKRFEIGGAYREVPTDLEGLAEYATAMLTRAKTQERPDLTEIKRAILEQEPES